MRGQHASQAPPPPARSVVAAAGGGRQGAGRRRCSPGASAVPANMEPHMTAEAPRARALTMCPLFCTPPSAVEGKKWGSGAT
jgi:hypothetical protein